MKTEGVTGDSVSRENGAEKKKKGKEREGPKIENPTNEITRRGEALS